MHKAPRSPPPYDVSICVRTSLSSSRPARPWSLGRCTRLRTPSTRHGVHNTGNSARIRRGEPYVGLAWTARPILRTDGPESCLGFQECSSGSAITKQSKHLHKHLHKQSAAKLLVVYGELFAQPGNAVIRAALWLDRAAHSLFPGAALWLPAVSESRLVQTTI